MSVAKTFPSDTAAHVRPSGRGPIPVPHEHGSWVVLYAPLLIGLLAGGRPSPAAAILLTLAATGAFLARNAAGLLVRGRGEADTPLWLALFSTLFGLTGAPLVFRYHRFELLALGAIFAAAFTAHSILLALQGRQRLDRSEWAELFGVAVLSISAPAGYVVSGGALDFHAGLLWAACFLYFGGPIFFVKMLLAAAKVKQTLTRPQRLRLAQSNLIYHTLVAAAVFTAAVALRAAPVLLLVSAFAPAIFRAFAGSARLSHRPPPLKKVGVGETLYAVWFTGCFTAFWMIQMRIH